MRTGFMFSGAFWGVILIILGISAILKSALNINLPLIRIAVSLFIIYIGGSLLFNGFHVEREQNTIIFNDRKVELSDSIYECNIIFSSGMIDLTDISLNKITGKKEVNIIFGRGVIRINPELPIKILITSVFAGVKLPAGNSMVFGDYTYQTEGFEEGENNLVLEVNVVFGSLDVKMED